MDSRHSKPGENVQRSGASPAGGGERRALALIKAMLPGPPPGEVWMGDDAAVIAVPGPRTGSLLFTIDTVVEGVHADLSLVGLDDLGWRAVTTAVSDIAAMGGSPDRLVVSVAGPPSSDLGTLYTGIAAAAEHCNTAVVGGELSTAPAIVVTVSVIGHVPGGGPAIERRGANPGDLLFVTGALGAAAAGLRILRSGPGDLVSSVVAGLVSAHKRPVARLPEGLAARLAGSTAMIDLSDGTASDVRQLAVASRVGVSLETLPVAEGATAHEALCGGDDYELLFTAFDKEKVRNVFEAAGLRPPLLIGRCTEDSSELLLEGHPMPDCGWEHPWVIPTSTTADR
jgi:thiamine-monophosphate kinase